MFLPPMTKLRTQRVPCVCSASRPWCSFVSFAFSTSNTSRLFSRHSPLASRHFFLMALLLLFSAPCGFSLDPSLDISQYAHTSWKVRDDFVKGALFAIAQTPDGYLWLGTESGLYRFDGMRAVLWQPPTGEHLPSNEIQRLMVSRDGTLWIGTAKGLGSWRDGRLTRYPELAERPILSFLEDHEGTIWAGEWQPPQGRLCAIRKSAVACYGGDGSLGWGALALFEDSKGSLWVGGGAPPNFGFWHWKPGSPKFYGLGNAAVPQSFVENSDRELLMGTPQGLVRLMNGKLEPLPHALPPSMRGLAAYRLQRDHEGSLWIGLFGGGLEHIHAGRTDVFTRSEGLSGNSIEALFEDREGSIWVVTQEGLDRFRTLAVPSWSGAQGVLASSTSASAVLGGKDGAIWADVDNGLAKLNEGEVTLYRQSPGTVARSSGQALREKIDRRLPDRFYALLQDHSDRLWISSPDGLGYLENEQFHAIPRLGTRIILSLVEDPTGDLWVHDMDKGLFRMHDGRVTQHIPWDITGGKDYGRSLAVDGLRGGLWIGFAGGGIVYVKDRQIRESYTVSNGLGNGIVNHLRVGPDGEVWAATEGGLSRIKNGHVSTLARKEGLPCDRVHWSIEDNDHALWLYMPCGLVRIASSEVDACLADPTHRVQATVFDANDGVRTVARLSGFYPQVSKARDGRIWFAAPDGISVIDPRHLPYNKIPPPVHIEQIAADGKEYDPARGPLPPLVRNLTIDYTALSLVVPEKVQFRFKLEGQDKAWREVVNVRHVEYTNLPPKHYRFRVLACNNSGVWNEEGAAMDFVILPAWYQTNWFLALCVAAFLALLWALYQYRLHQMARQFNMRLEERVCERTRIARDLHDTLLQSFHGILLHFQTGINLLQEHTGEARTAEARKTLEKAMHQAKHAIVEGREAIQGLRSSVVETNDLALAMRTLGEELAANANSTVFQVHVEGTPRDLHPILRDEVYRITGEGIRNAFRHADAKQIEVEIQYDDKRLRVRVRDDGKGIDPKLLSDSEREGHFGLRGMRERGKLIGGKLTVWSELDAGTEMDLSIPASRAYPTATDGHKMSLAGKLLAKLSGQGTVKKP